MATGAFIAHSRSLDCDEELMTTLGLPEGTRLIVESHDDREIVLRHELASDTAPKSIDEVLQAWRSLTDDFKPLVPWTAEWQAKAEERKQRASEALDRVYADPNSGATELKAAEREWELADDELDFGPSTEE